MPRPVFLVLAALFGVLAVLGGVSYWVIDRASTHSAISETNPIAPPRPVVLPRPSVVDEQRTGLNEIASAPTSRVMATPKGHAWRPRLPL